MAWKTRHPCPRLQSQSVPIIVDALCVAKPGCMAAVQSRNVALRLAEHSASKISVMHGGAAENLDGLCSEPKVAPVLDGATGSQRDLDPVCVVPKDVGVQRRDKVLDGRGQSAARVEQLGLQAAEEALTRSVVRRACLARHRARKPCIGDPRQPSRPPIVGTAIGMHNRPFVAG